MFARAMRERADPPSNPAHSGAAPVPRGRWSWRVGTFFGIETRIHVTFVLLLALIAWVSWQSVPSWVAMFVTIGFVVAIFGSVLLHEYGHALMARRFGIGTREIILLPIGGVAQLTSMPRDAKQEFWVAIAGPLVNVVIAAILAIVVYGVGPIVGLPGVESGLLDSLLWANVGLAIFNMLPAFPMDGGRVFRAALELRWGRLKATEIAVLLGRVIAVGLGLWGLYGNPMLVLIAVFVWVAAGRELGMVRKRAELEAQLHEIGLTPDQWREVQHWLAVGRPFEIRVVHHRPPNEGW
jgi:Zn-dependent protease